MYSSALYKASPIPLQSALLSGRSWLRRRMREGRRFESMLSEALYTQWLSATELEEYQRQHLSALMEHARATVAFYRGHPADYVQFRLDAPRSQWLAGVPTLTKEDVRSAGDALRSSVRRWPLFKGSTSGSTGTPLAMVQDLYAITRENAFLARQLQWAGWNPGERRAWIRGDAITPVEQDAPPFWRTNSAEQMLMLSSFHLSESHCAAYVDAMAAFGPTVVQAYPSSIAFIAAWLDVQGREYPGPPLKGIVTSSEAISPDQVTCIERRFGCRVFDWYGQFERVAAIGTCEQGNRHLISDYSFVELQPSDDDPQQHEIIGTGFNNFSMPLIRYRTGDHVRLPAHGSAACACGRSFPVVERIVGREDDLLELPGKRVVSRGLGYIIKDVPGIIASQIRQSRAGDIRILVVSGHEFDAATRHKILQRARDRLGHDVALSIERVDEIERGRNGKYAFIVRE